MTELLTVDNIEMSRLPGERTMLFPAKAEGSCYFLLRVIVTNHSPHETVYATGAVTGVDYDPEGRVLHVRFHAPGGSPEGPRTIVVEHLPVGPGETIVLEARIASPVTFLDRHSELRWEPRMVRLDTEVDRIELTITYSDTAPPPRLNLAVETHGSEAIWREAHSALPIETHP
jgi:hypothetical protein